MTTSFRADPAWDPTDLWDDYRPTPLVELPELARLTNVGRVFIKVEAERPLGNFKVLGGMIAGLRALARAAGATSLRDLCSGDTSLPRLICASDGNHGLAVAAAARRAGTSAAVYLPNSVSRMRAERIQAFGAEVIRVTGTYDDAVCDAAAATARGEGLLIPDTSPDLDDPVVRDVMDGYALLTRELASQFHEQMSARPSHVLVQAGVGGLAAAMANGLCELMQAPNRLLVVEPESAACVAHALMTGHPVRIPGELRTSAQMLSCGLASAPALHVLQKHGARSVLVSEDQLQSAVAALHQAGGPDTTPSGAAGIAGLLQVAASADLRAEHRLDSQSNVLLVVTEGPLAADG